MARGPDREGVVQLDLARRTPAEELWLTRYARGETQAAAAARLGACRTRLWAWETGRARVPAWAVPGPQRPALGALLALARRRAGMGYRGTARALGVTGPTLTAWERAGDARLVAFWSSRGFRGLK